MNTGQKILFRALGVTTLMSVLLILYYNLSPNYVDEQGFLVEEFWTLGLATFGLGASLLGLLILFFWLWVSSRKAKKPGNR
jgi:hypothetical protein